ncbi:hypothetical protein CERZMDRAFT_31403 [Cercospora zeae-maydis SCOH1-5]|uniref:Uncharacterized protein n=1 Tax=Cercospora zeae-maydis SCOH1-5 TaxID=717836 RepID=A0A6A6FW07_9PEZI|nr:hypothetical protein CERZMDRAFT_31403 [Cercospora zeae-maydis SCOH1-5]
MALAARPKPLVWINGFPGVGKLTLARELVKLYADGNVVLIDNHQLIDPVAARFQREEPQYNVERQKERQKALERWVLDQDNAQKLVVFTDCQSNNELGIAVGGEYKHAALESGRAFVPVVLDCDRRENLRRAVSKERQESGTTKLTDLEMLAKLREDHVMLKPDLPTQLSINVSELSPGLAAQKLYDHIASIQC